MIAADQVVARYPRSAAPALAGVSFTAQPGALTVIAGPNGSGKSTLVRLLLGRLPLESGRLTIAGVDVAHMDPLARARQVAVVTQREEPAFPIGVRDYVSLGRFPHVRAWGAPDSPQLRRRMLRGHAVMASVRRGAGEVFNSGPTEWAYGLAARNPFVERITRNVLERVLGS